MLGGGTEHGLLRMTDRPFGKSRGNALWIFAFGTFLAEPLVPVVYNMYMRPFPADGYNYPIVTVIVILFIPPFPVNCKRNLYFFYKINICPQALPNATTPRSPYNTNATKLTQLSFRLERSGMEKSVTFRCGFLDSPSTTLRLLEMTDLDA